MGLADTLLGTPGTTTVGQTPSLRPPGYQQAGQIFNWLLGLTNQPFPTYQGQVDPGLSPTMQDLIRRSQGYASAGPSEFLQGVQGRLGQFMNPNFLNPQTRIFGGATDYSGASTSPWNDQWRFDPFGTQNPQKGVPSSGQGIPTQGSSAYESMFGGGQSAPQLQPMSDPYTAGGGSGGIYANPNQSHTPYSPAQQKGAIPFFSDRQAGAKPMWDMGRGANRGEIRQGANGLEMLMGSGRGGESYEWKPYTGEYGQQQNAAMFQRYGPNWTAGSGASGGHSSDVNYWFEMANGRPPTESETYDYYYGVKDAAPLRQAAKQANARYDPSSASYGGAAANQELVDLWKRSRTNTQPAPAPRPPISTAPPPVNPTGR